MGLFNLSSYPMYKGMGEFKFEILDDMKFYMCGSHYFVIVGEEE